MATERNYTINLRREFQKAPKYKYSSKAIRSLKEFLKKHMKSDNVIIGKYLNQEIWKNGPRNPPGKVKIKVIKDGDKIKAELIGAPEEIIEAPKPKKKKPQTMKEKLQEKVKESKEVPKKEPKKDEVPKAEELAKKKEEAKKVEKQKEEPKEEKPRKILTSKDIDEKVPSISELVERKNGNIKK